MLQSMGSQRVGYDLVTEKQQSSKSKAGPRFCVCRQFRGAPVLLVCAPHSKQPGSSCLCSWASLISEALPFVLPSHHYPHPWSLSTQPLGSPHLCRHEVKLKYGSRGSVERDFAIAVVTGAPRSPACLPETQTQNVGSEPPMFPLPDPGLPPNPISGLPLGPWRRSGTDS